GAARDASSIPILPAAPGRLSTRNCWPKASASFAVTRRVVISTPAPGGKLTMTRTGLIGYDCAAAAEDSSTPQTLRKHSPNSDIERSEPTPFPLKGKVGMGVGSAIRPIGMLLSVVEIARFEVRAKVRRIERLAARAARQLRRFPAARLRPDVRREPLEDGREIARRDAGIEVRGGAPQRREPLRGVHRAQRVARKVAEGPFRPVHVLHAAVAVVAARVDAEERLYLFVPQRRYVLDLDRALDEGALDLVAQDDVGGVGDLVGIHADQPGPHAREEAVQVVRAERGLRAEMRREQRREESDERPAARELHLERQALALVDAVGARSADRLGEPRPRQV